MMRKLTEGVSVAAVALAAIAAQGAEKWPETPPPTGKSVTWGGDGVCPRGSFFSFQLQ